MPKRPRPRYYQDPPLKVFGERVRLLREARGWSQMELGHQADRHFTYLSSLERGGRHATLITFLRLGKALDVDPAVFITTDEGHVRREVARLKRLAAK